MGVTTDDIAFRSNIPVAADLTVAVVYAVFGKWALQRWITHTNSHRRGDDHGIYPWEPEGSVVGIVWISCPSPKPFLLQLNHIHKHHDARQDTLRIANVCVCVWHFCVCLWGNIEAEQACSPQVRNTPLSNTFDRNTGNLTHIHTHS